MLGKVPNTCHVMRDDPAVIVVVVVVVAFAAAVAIALAVADTVA